MSDDIFWGSDSNGRPVSTPRSRLGHVHITGCSGEGKTSLTLIPVTRQLLRPYELDGNTRRDMVAVYDLGSDNNLLENFERECIELRIPYQIFVLDPQFKTAHLSPFQGRRPGQTRSIAVAQTLITAFHMEHGLLYGGNYYTGANLAALYAVSQKANSIENVARYLDKHRREYKDADQVRMTFQFLLDYPQLRPCEDPDNNIVFDKAIERGEALYFYIPCLEEPITSRLVAGLAFQLLLNAAIQRKKRGRNTRGIRILVDEFQALVGPSFATFLPGCRKYGRPMSLFLVNQYVSQLENRDVSVLDAVAECCDVRQVYTAFGKRDSQELQLLAKETTMELYGRNTGLLEDTAREVIVSSLSRNTILEVSSTRGLSFLLNPDGTGHHNPIILSQSYQYPDYSDVPLDPVDPTGGPLAISADDIPVTSESQRATRHERLSKLVAAKRAAQRWE